MTEQAYRNGNTLARQDTVVVLICEVPDIRKYGGREVGAIEYLDGSVTGYDAQLLGICLGKDLVNERNLSGCGRELGHDYDASLEGGRSHSGCAEAGSTGWEYEGAR